MIIPYSVPFEKDDYPFDTEGLVKLDLSDVEWVNYGIQPDGADPNYLPGLRWSAEYRGCADVKCVPAICGPGLHLLWRRWLRKEKAASFALTI